MPRYIAFLRGVSPLNAKMPELKRSFEMAGFTEVRTLLSSGNVAFSVRAAPLGHLQQRAEAAMTSELGRSFNTIIRSAAYLQALIASEPFAEFQLAAASKQVITFLHEPAAISIQLPIEQDGACILKLAATEVFTSYVPHPKGPIFMNLLERHFGKNITTRTLETVKKCATA
jgi:uncharacterized protein (DUF1697 family)